MLYHYTNAAGLLGILEGRIWLTNIQVLNDEQEFEDGFKYLEAEVKRYTAQVTATGISKSSDLGEIKPEAVIDHLKQLMKHLHATNSYAFNGRNFIFVFSLSSKYDQLSQWRSYCPEAGGFSIGFTEEGILKLVREQSNWLTLKPCVYTAEEKREKTNQLLSMIADDYLNFITSTHTLEEVHMSPLLFTQVPVMRLTELAATFKSSSFHEESESRIIANGFPLKQGIQFSYSANYLKPRIELEFPANLITEIVIGPTKDKARAEIGIKMKLQSMGLLDKVSVKHSEISFRAG